MIALTSNIREPYFWVGWIIGIVDTMLFALLIWFVKHFFSL